MQAMMMEQMERITPSSESLITIEDRAAQLKRDLHPLRTERKISLNPRPQAPDFYALFYLIA